jgi:2',3'-cyclic-nucleotide 2'-phosphodiesterase (5'-nucleotidase family)
MISPKRIFALLAASLFILSGCSPRHYAPASVVWTDYRMYESTPKDSAVQVLLKTYSDGINATMNNVIGKVAETLEKSGADGTLGLFMTDAYYQAALEKYGTPVHLSFMNTGGIRLTSLPAGNITVSKMYELMPFDNLLVLLDMKGAEVRTLFNHIAGRGGWPLAGGSYTITADRKAISIEVAGAPLDDTKTYRVAIGDYTANGGDDCGFLKDLPRKDIGLLQRDALIEYVKKQCAGGKAIPAPTQGRVIKLNP